MKIKKTFQGSLPENRILNTHSSSQTDTYSCNYINDSSVVVSAIEPTENRKRVWIQKGKNLFDKNQVEKSCYIDSSGLKIVNSGWCITNFIKVIHKKEYSYQGLTVSGTAPYSAYYDKNKNYISSFKQATGNNNITIPENAYYIRFSICLKDIPAGIDFNDLNTFQIEQGSETTDYEEYIEPKIYIKNENDVYEEFMNEEESLTKESINKLVYASSDFSDHSNFGGSYYYKIGSRVHLHIGMNTEKTTSSTIATLPEIYRPNHSVAATGIGNNINDITFLRVSSDGNIDVQTSSKYALIDIEYDILK